MMHERTQILVVGGGPSGLASAATLQRAGYPTLILERGVFAHGVAAWPYYMKMFSSAERVELGGFPLTIPEEKPTRHQYLRYLHRFAAAEGLDVRLHHEVSDLEGRAGAFVATGRTWLGEPFEVHAEIVVLATGAYDHPNMLGIPGENLPKVSHYYTEINDYIGHRTLIVGGRHSAAEAALELCRAGVEVTICHRKPFFVGLKYWVGPDLQNRIDEGRITVFLDSRLLEIKPRSVVIEPAGGTPRELENDRVIALTGYQPNPEQLRRFGLDVNLERGQPVFCSESLESSRPGVYLAGVLLAGDLNGAIFIENSRHHGRQVLEDLRRKGCVPRTGSA